MSTSAAATVMTAKPYRQTIFMARLCHGVAFLLNEVRKPQLLCRSRRDCVVHAMAYQFLVARQEGSFVYERRNHEKIFQCYGGRMSAEFVVGW